MPDILRNPFYHKLTNNIRIDKTSRRSNSMFNLFNPFSMSPDFMGDQTLPLMKQYGILTSPKNRPNEQSGGVVKFKTQRMKKRYNMQ